MLSQLNLGGPEAEIMPIDSFYLRMSSFSTRDVPQGWQRQIYLPVLVVSSFQHSECSAKCPGPSSHIFLPKTQRLYANKFISKKGHNQDATNLMVDNLGSCQNISNCLRSKNKSHLSTGHSHNSKNWGMSYSQCLHWLSVPPPKQSKTKLLYQWRIYFSQVSSWHWGIWEGENQIHGNGWNYLRRKYGVGREEN